MTVADLSLQEAVSAIRAGELSSRKYVQGLLDRIDQIDPRVQAWVTIDRDSILTEADACDTEARNGQFRGPLHGIPIGIKDLFHTKGLRTTFGSSLFSGFVPANDAAIVSTLRRAGAIIMGKLVTTPFAFLDPVPSTRNPWNPAHTPGGSSSGSAAAVAARMCPASIGSQTVGSVGRPASFNGLVSLVPTQKKISRQGAFPLAPSLDHVGMFARSVADIELLYNSIVASATSPNSKNRIGLVRDFFYENADPELRTHLDELAKKLSQSGFEVLDVHLPEIFRRAQTALRTILCTEAATAHRQLYKKHRDSYGPKLGELIEAGFRTNAVDYLDAKAVRRKYQRDMRALLRSCDVLMTPAARGPAPEGIASTGDAIMNGPWTLADFPTMTLPHALASNGLPLGVQLSAAPSSEGLLLRAAKSIESVIDFRARPAL